jgi:uncharacterized protein GlcG (DUF336 family)
MSTLTLESAARIVDGALEHAKTLKLKPLTVAVLDAGGHLVAFKRQDRSGILRPDIAQGKAWGDALWQSAHSRRPRSSWLLPARRVGASFRYRVEF